MSSIILLKYFILFFFLISIFSNAYSEIIILGKCDSKRDVFIKNEYILDLEKSLMTRNYIYNSKTFKKHKITDLSVKKNNTITRIIYQAGNKIFTTKIGYPQFYTQLFFEKNNLNVKIKTVINDESTIEKLAQCKTIEVFDKGS